MFAISHASSGVSENPSVAASTTPAVQLLDSNGKPIEIRQIILTVYDRSGKICDTYSQKQGQLY